MHYPDFEYKNKIWKCSLLNLNSCFVCYLWVICTVRDPFLDND